MRASNPRLQRTRTAPLRSPLSFETLGALKGGVPRWRRAAGAFPLLVGLVLAIGCAHTIYDYSFRAEGVVLDPDGHPVPRVWVRLEIAKPVYQAITPVTHADTYTDVQGRFAFTYISHDGDPSYTLGFEKPGYQSVSIEGAIQAMNPHSVKMVPVAK